MINLKLSSKFISLFITKHEVNTNTKKTWSKSMQETAQKRNKINKKA
jgi:hypothetical protein